MMLPCCMVSPTNYSRTFHLQFNSPANQNFRTPKTRYCTMYPPVIKHGVLENGPFISDFPILLYRKITDKWSIFHCHDWLPEGNAIFCGTFPFPPRAHLPRQLPAWQGWPAWPARQAWQQLISGTRETGGSWDTTGSLLRNNDGIWWHINIS